MSAPHCRGGGLWGSAQLCLRFLPRGCSCRVGRTERGRQWVGEGAHVSGGRTGAGRACPANADTTRDRATGAGQRRLPRVRSDLVCCSVPSGTTPQQRQSTRTRPPTTPSSAAQVRVGVFSQGGYVSSVATPAAPLTSREGVPPEGGQVGPRHPSHLWPLSLVLLKMAHLLLWRVHG